VESGEKKNNFKRDLSAMEPSGSWKYFIYRFKVNKTCLDIINWYW